MAAISEQMSHLALTESEPMRRPGFGMRGQKVKVLTNTFKISPTDTCLTAYHYDVKIGPTDERRPPRLNRAIWKQLASQNPFAGIAVAYDGRAMAYAAKKLADEEKEYSLQLAESDGSTSARSNAFTVKITFIRPIHLDALKAFVTGRQRNVDEGVVMSAVQALNVVIKHGPFMTHPNKAASFFLPPQNKQEATIPKGLEIWRGYYTSLRPGPGSVFINVDLSSHPMMLSGNLPSVMVAYAKAKSPRFTAANLAAATFPAKENIDLSRFLRNLKITIRARDQDGRQQHRKIKELTRVAANKETFQLENGQTTNVAAFMKSQYGITLEHPDWPCVRVSKVAKWPIELCDIHAGQKYGKKLDPQQTADSLKLTTIGHRDRVPLLRNGINTIRPTNAGSPLNQWGLQISQELMQVEARILPAPQVAYKGPTPQKLNMVMPGSGTWDLRGKQFLQACTSIDRWMVFVFDRQQYFSLQDVQQSVGGFVQGLTSSGIRVNNPRPPIVYAPPMNAAAIAGFIRDEAKKAGLGGPPQLLLCYLARKPCDEYAAIKVTLWGQDVGVATQCLSVPKAKRGNPQYYANVAMKVNVKLNGINSKVDLGPAVAGVPTMIFGADVSHPAPGSFAPSIAAVVGTVNKEFTLYGSSIRIQSSRVEVIETLEEMVIDLLRQHAKSVKAQPQRLIFFRDGVSEGQFSQVMASEVNAIRVACQRLDPKYKPSITYIVCGKRHHISMFPVSPNDGDKTGNVKAGTTIDTDITSAFNFDWYTQSHASLLGTSRSAHYTVLVDEAKFSADVLQQLVYNLCYTYARCTRSVSYATPAYYADRLCTRAALYLNAEADDATSAMSSHSGASADQERSKMMADYRSRIKSIHANHAQALFYM